MIIRLRGTDQIGLSLVEVLRRFAHELRDAGSSLKLVVSEKRVLDQIEADGLADDLGERQHLPQHASGSARRCAAPTPTRAPRSRGAERRDTPLLLRRAP